MLLAKSGNYWDDPIKKAKYCHLTLCSRLTCHFLFPHFQLRSTSSGQRILRSILGRCPTCYSNVAKMTCEMACSPGKVKKGVFPGKNVNLGVQREGKGVAMGNKGSSIISRPELLHIRGQDDKERRGEGHGPGNSHEHLGEIRPRSILTAVGYQWRCQSYQLVFLYFSEAYSSCGGVTNPSTSSPVMDLVCGPWGSGKASSHLMGILWVKEVFCSIRLFSCFSQPFALPGGC